MKQEPPSRWFSLQNSRSSPQALQDGQQGVHEHDHGGGSPESYIDFRSDYDSLSYELIDPPTGVVDGVRRLMAAMDLVYGALDFVVGPGGTWTFLEVNAGGQFGFIEDGTGARASAC